MVLEANTLVRGKYRITRLIGDGGMGAVYQAEHLILRVPVALKFLHANLAERPGLAERFLREARVSANIQSPYVTRVTDVDKTDAGTPFLVMELLRGESLQERLDREQRFPQATCIDYALQILSGLEAAHALNVVHRDLKPDNVFITDSPIGPLLKLIDFGIAKLRSSEEFKQTLTRAGAMMGTPEYMAPEQLYSAENVDARADLFSLGVMLYEMLCGSRPVDGDEAIEIIAKFVNGSVVPLQQRLPGVDERLARTVHRALEPDRDNRFESAFAMRMALVPLAQSLSQAGQLAAASAPHSASEAAPASAVNEPDPSTRRTSVADTLPPAEATPSTTQDEPVMPERGYTEEVALPNLQARSHYRAAAMAPPPSPIAERAAAAVRIQQAGVPNDSRRSSRRSRKGNGLITALIVLLVIIGGAMAVLVVRSQRPATPATGLPLENTPPAGTLQPDPIPSPPAIEEPVPTRPTEPGRRPSSPAAGPAPAPARPGAGPVDAGPADAAPVFPFPSRLPPLPSSLPPFPSSFPTALPSFLPPIPGFTPPPAATPPGDAGP